MRAIAAGPTSSSGVSAGKRRQVLEVLDTKDLGLSLVERETNGGTGGRDVLERSRSRDLERSSKLLDESPRVERIEQVDVSGASRHDCVSVLARRISQVSRLTSDEHLAVLNKRLGGLLVRVGTVSQRQALVSDTGSGLALGRGVQARVLLTEVVADGLVVRRSLLERLQGESSSGLLGDGALGLELGDDRVVVGRRADDGRSAVVLGSGSEESDTTDVNLLDGAGEGAVGLLRLQDEGVQVANDQGDGGDAVGLEVGEVGGDIPGEDS